jgi:flagellar biosynthesis/type III secretory pathway M-ring protein FliF/YscJ
MEAFLTGFLYVLGGGVGLAALGILLNASVQGVVKFRKREKEKVRPGVEDRKQLLLEANEQADNLYANNETVRAVVDELELAEGKRDRAKLQKRLRDLIDDEVIRRVFYSRTR